MSRLKKILNWFKYSPERELEGFGFKKIDDGQTLFFPWGEPGESVFVTKKDRIYIVLALISYVCLFCIFIFGLIYVDINNLHPLIDDKFMPLIFVYFGVFYYPLIYLLIINKEFNIEPKNKRIPRKKYKWYAWPIGIIVVLYWLAQTRMFIFAPYNIVLLCGIAFLLWAVLTTKKHNGYFFTND